MNNQTFPDVDIPGKTADFGTHSIYYVDVGQGLPLLFLHGGFQDHRGWGGQIKELSERFRCIACDTRGHGRSTGVTLAASYAEYGRDCIRLLDTLGIERASLIGFSDGGCTALAMAIDSPERLHKLVLIGTPYNKTNYHPGILDRFESISLADFESNAPARMRVNIERMKEHMDEGAWKAYWNRIMKGLWLNEPQFDLRSFRGFGAPVLILHGENEQYFPLDASVALAGAFPNAELRIVPGAGHGVAQEQPATTNELIVEFLSKGDGQEFSA